jgi:mRNA-degrading endonuclease YafQ of YafQ-DinJ toxin-antitoxin module
MRNDVKLIISVGMLFLVSNRAVGSAKSLTLAGIDVLINPKCQEIDKLMSMQPQIERQFGNWGWSPLWRKIIYVLDFGNEIMGIIFERRPLSTEEGAKLKTVAFSYSIASIIDHPKLSPRLERFELIYKGESLGNRPLIHPVLFRAISEMSSKPFPEVAALPQVFPQLIAFLGQRAEPTMLADVLLSSVFQADPQLLQEALQAFVIMNELQNPVFLPILAQTLMSVLVHSGTGRLQTLLSEQREMESLLSFSPIPQYSPMRILLRSLYSPSIMSLALCFPEVLEMAITGSELLAAILMPLLVEQFPAFAPAMEISQLLPILEPVAKFLYRLHDQEQEAAIALVRAFLEVLLSPDLDELLSVLSPYPQALALELVARMLFQAACPSPLESYHVLETLLGDAGMNDPASEQLAMFGIQQLNAMMRNPDYSKLTDGHPLTGPFEGCYAVGISGGGRIIYAIDHSKKQVILVGMTPTHDYDSLKSQAKAILNLLKE